MYLHFNEYLEAEKGLNNLLKVIRILVAMTQILLQMKLIVSSLDLVKM